MRTIPDKIKDLLLSVEKPARYTGGELNSCEPDFSAPPAGPFFLMCFPDVYEVGMSNLGIKILYHMLNDLGFPCERAFAPWPDMAAAMRRAGQPLYGLESGRAATDFAMLGFSLQYELCYTNVLYMLELAGIPFLAKDREGGYPLIIAGGPCCVNPAPVSGIFDLFVIGDGEKPLAEICRLYKEVNKGVKNGLNAAQKAAFLKKAGKIRGVYSPLYSSGSTVKEASESLDSLYFPHRPIVSGLETVHDRAVLELFRGCTRGCRFCQAGFIYRPLRERSEESLLTAASALISGCGYEELGLSSLSTCDYTRLKTLLPRLKAAADKAGVTLSLPSVRADSFEASFSDARLASLTFAPEAGTQRLRDVINKNITENDIFSCCRAAAAAGYRSAKLYFMLGLPTETDEDALEIARLAIAVKNEMNRHKPKGAGGVSVSVSTSVFIPKPFTPFQWEAQADPKAVAARQNLIKAELRPRGIKYSYHDISSSQIEAGLARGGAEVQSALLAAYRAGCVLDGWTEFFLREKWDGAFTESGVSLAALLAEIPEDAPLPWDNIDVLVTKSFLIRERRKAYSAALSPDCRESCLACGAGKSGDCHRFAAAGTEGGE